MTQTNHEQIQVFWITDDDNVWSYIKTVGEQVFTSVDAAVEFAKSKVDILRDPMSEYLVVGIAQKEATKKDMPKVLKQIFLAGGKVIVEDPR